MVDVRLGLILLSLLFTLPLSRSATVTWNVADGDWSNDINWDTGTKPGALDRAVIPVGTTAVVTTTEIVDEVDNAGTIEISASAAATLQMTYVGASSGLWIVNGSTMGRGSLKSTNGSPGTINGELGIHGGVLEGKWIWGGSARELNQEQLYLKTSPDAFYVPNGLILRDSELITEGASLSGLTEMHQSILSLTTSAPAPACPNPNPGFLISRSAFAVTGPETCVAPNYRFVNSTLTVVNGAMELTNANMWVSALHLDHATLKISGVSSVFDEASIGSGEYGSVTDSTLIFGLLSQTLNLEWTSRLLGVGTNQFIFGDMSLNFTGPSFPNTGTNEVTFDSSTVEFRFPAVIPPNNVLIKGGQLSFVNYNENTLGDATPTPLQSVWLGSYQIYLENSNLQMIHTPNSPNHTDCVLPAMLKCIGTCQFSVYANSSTWNQACSTMQTWNVEMVLRSGGLRVPNNLSWYGSGSFRIDPILPSPTDKFPLILTDNAYTYPDIQIPIRGSRLDVRGGGRVENLAASDSSLYITVSDGIYGTKLNLTRGTVQGDTDAAYSFLIKYDTMEFHESLVIEQGANLLAQSLDIRGCVVWFNLTKDGWSESKMPRLDTQTAMTSNGTSDTRRDFESSTVGLDSDESQDLDERSKDAQEDFVEISKSSKDSRQHSTLPKSSKDSHEDSTLPKSSKDSRQHSTLPKSSKDADWSRVRDSSSSSNALGPTTFNIVVSDEMLARPDVFSFVNEVFFTSQASTDPIAHNFVVEPSGRTLGNCLAMNQRTPTSGGIELSLTWSDPATTRCEVYAAAPVPRSPTSPTPYGPRPTSRNSSRLPIVLGIFIPLFLLFFIIPLTIACVKNRRRSHTPTAPTTVVVTSNPQPTDEPLIYASPPPQANYVEMSNMAPQPPPPQQPYTPQQPYASQQPYAQPAYAPQPQAPYPNSPYGVPADQTYAANYGAGAGYHQ